VAVMVVVVAVLVVVAVVVAVMVVAVMGEGSRSGSSLLRSPHRKMCTCMTQWPRRSCHR
jgi:hypothetical protein